MIVTDKRFALWTMLQQRTQSEGKTTSYQTTKWDRESLAPSCQENEICVRRALGAGEWKPIAA